MTKSLLIWLGTTLEISALIAVIGAAFVSKPAGDGVLITVAAILLVNGVSLQFFSAELRRFDSAA